MSFSKERNSWPHVFVKQGELTTADNGIVVNMFKCKYCDLEWNQAGGAQPIDKCPSRTDESVLKKLFKNRIVTVDEDGYTIDDPLELSEGEIL